MITRRLARPLSASSGGWTCPACTRSSNLQQRVAQLQRRRLHHVPPLTHQSTFEQEGVPGLFSPTGFNIAWTTYQGMIIQKLNELTAGEDIENVQPKDIVIRYARSPMDASLFNHASMAHNNQIFFSKLSTAPQHIDKVPGLKESLEAGFGSMDTLRTTMLDTAAAMFGPGFVWLVWTQDPQNENEKRYVGRLDGAWRVLTTYLAGTPYPEAGYRQQGIDMNTSDANSFRDYQDQQPVNNVASFGPYSGSRRAPGWAKIPPGGTSVMPVLCVNTWEHAYIYDYGLKGKRKYLSDWWDAVDWDQVNSETPKTAQVTRFPEGPGP